MEHKTTKPEKKPTTKTPRKRAAPKPAPKEHEVIVKEEPVIETAPAVESIAIKDIPKEVEAKAVTILGRIKRWKFFWLAVGILAILLIIGGFVWFNSIKNKQADKKTEQKKEELKQIEVGGDTTLLQLKTTEARRIRRVDSIIEAGLHALNDLKRANDYQKSTMPKLIEEIDQKTINTRETINNPVNTDDDVRRNAKEQVSRAIQRGQAPNNGPNR